MDLTKAEIIALLADEANEQNLFKKADEIRRKNVGDEVHLRGLIEFSNICRNNCLYCGIRKDNKHACRYRMEPEEVERSYADYKAFREAGADRYLMRIETTDKELYHRLDPQMSWQHRYECLLMIKELGYELGSGIMVGLPGQTLESIANDLLFLQELEIDMAGIGPFIPHPDTPLSKEKGGTLELALRTMAVMRIMLPDINIPATTAMESLHPDGRMAALRAGANVVMPNVTEGEYRRLYELYPGKAGADEIPAHSRSMLAQKILSLGRTIGTDYGSHIRK